MAKLDFKTWLEMADYGFDKVKKPTGAKAPPDDALPIDPIDSHLIIRELRRMPPLGQFLPEVKWNDVINWGNEVGALQIDISPLGSYKIVTRRKVKDLQGETTWICKGVLALNEESEYNKNEPEIADELYQTLKEVSGQMIQGPAKEYPHFEKLANALNNATAREYPDYCMFPVGFKKISDDYYKCVFEFRGHGMEAPTTMRAEQFDIDLYWDKKKGLIRCWGYDIDSQTKQHDWRVMPSEWDEWFSPGQPIKEICEIVVGIFMTY